VLWYYPVGMENNTYGIIVEEPKHSCKFRIMLKNLTKDYATELADSLNDEEKTKEVRT
jgi:hypothetical protein